MRLSLFVLGIIAATVRAVLPCRPNAPFAELVRLSRTSIADEMREEHRQRVLAESHRPLPPAVGFK